MKCANDSSKNIENDVYPCDLCSQLPPQKSELWSKFKKQIINAIAIDDEINHPNHTLFSSWIEDLMEYYNPERLKVSTSNPPSRRSIQRIINVLSNYPSTKEPLKILVTGGSITAGNAASNQNPSGLLIGPQKWNYPWKESAWPARLENIINKVFFDGKPAVTVFNAALGGASSSVASMMLDYGLLPENIREPHVVLLAHSANDAKEKDQNAVFFDHIQDTISE